MSISLIAEEKAKTVIDLCRRHSLRLTTVESCTGGLIAAALTDIAGSSDIMECGFVTYSNAAKTMLVGVPAEMIETYGAISRQVAMAMAEGGLKHSRADIAVAVTGIAGPDGGSETKPVGLVHMAVAYRNHETLHYEARFGTGRRDRIRHAAVEQALALVAERIQQN
jgi:nicotinamide-nucleotide amidase